MKGPRLLDEHNDTTAFGVFTLAMLTVAVFPILGLLVGWLSWMESGEFHGYLSRSFQSLAGVVAAWCVVYMIAWLFGKEQHNA